MGLFQDKFSIYKKAGEPLYKTPKSVQECIEIFLNFSAVHYQMGFENASLLYAQRPDARMVETYSGWREKGRYVRRGRPEIWRLDKENEKEILSLLHAKSGNVQGYVREAVESEIYGKDKKYIENISDLCRCNDSQNPEHIYNITKAVPE